jgi:hypothetical protein
VGDIAERVEAEDEWELRGFVGRCGGHVESLCSVVKLGEG